MSRPWYWPYGDGDPQAEYDDEPENEMSDKQALHQLMTERHERVTAALYNAAMLGLPPEDLKILCAEVGITYPDLCRYTPPVLRASTKE